MTGVFSKEYIPLGTRFGPLQGEIYTKDNVPKQANRKYFWRVREDTLTWRIGLRVMGEHLKYPLRKAEKKESASVNSWQLTQHLPVLVLKNQLVSPMQKFLLKSMSLRQEQAFSQTAVPHRSFGQKFWGSFFFSWCVSCFTSTESWNEECHLQNKDNLYSCLYFY